MLAVLESILVAESMKWFIAFLNALRLVLVVGLCVCGVIAAVAAITYFFGWIGLTITVGVLITGFGLYELTDHYYRYS